MPDREVATNRFTQLGGRMRGVAIPALGGAFLSPFLAHDFEK
jgi:hypothetical protein